MQRARLGSASWARRGETDAGERIGEKENASTGGNLPLSMQTAQLSQTARETLGVIIRVAMYFVNRIYALGAKLCGTVLKTVWEC